MDRELILKNESLNDGKTVFLYFNEEIGCYIAYGLSAFYVNHVIDADLSYSMLYQMPLVILHRNHVTELLRALKKIEFQKDSFYRLETKNYIGDHGYEAWVARIQR